MRITLFVLLFFNAFAVKAQDNYTLFPGTDCKFILPDSSFHINHDSSGFFSAKYRAKIELLGDAQSDAPQADYDSFVGLLLQELARGGNTILLDKQVPGKNIRLLKNKIDFDVTDSRPAEKGVSNISWLLLFNQNGKVIMLNAEYRLEHDKALGEVFLRSLSSFSKR